MPDEDRFTMEQSIKVFDDKSGEYVYVGPDSDGLDLAELRYTFEYSGGKNTQGFVLKPKMMVMVAKAILKLWGDEANSN